MAIRVPGIMHAKQIFLRSATLIQERASVCPDVPKGLLAVYVGEKQLKRYAIPISFLDQPLFQNLLRKAEEEYGFEHPMGGLTIPFREDLFLSITFELNLL